MFVRNQFLWISMLIESINFSNKIQNFSLNQSVPDMKLLGSENLKNFNKSTYRAKRPVCLSFDLNKQLAE